MSDIDVKELRHKLLKFLKQNPLYEMNEHFGNFVERSKKKAVVNCLMDRNS